MMFFLDQDDIFDALFLAESLFCMYLWIGKGHSVLAMIHYSGMLGVRLQDYCVLQSTEFNTGPKILIIL